MCYSGQSLLPRKSSIDKYKAFNNSWLLIIPNTSPSSMSTTALQLQNISAEHLPVCVQFQNITLSFFLLQIFSRSILVQAFFHFFCYLRARFCIEKMIAFAPPKLILQLDMIICWAFKECTLSLTSKNCRCRSFARSRRVLSFLAE